MKIIQSSIRVGGRNHLDAICPQCGGQLLDRSPGNVPGSVQCGSCGWMGIWVKTLNPWDMEKGGSVACFREEDPK
jgi:hypothetical protein